MAFNFKIALGCCDMIVVVTLPSMYGITVLNLPNFPTVDDQISKYDVLLPSILSPILWPMCSCAHLTGIYLMVLLAGERYVAICRKHIIGMKKTKVFTICIVSVCILFNISSCWVFEWKTDSFESGNFTICTTSELVNNHSSLFVQVRVWANVMIRTIIPIFCFVIFNFLMIKKVGIKQIFLTLKLFYNLNI